MTTETPGFDPDQHPDNIEAIPLDDDTEFGGDPVIVDESGFDHLLPVAVETDPITED